MILYLRLILNISASKLYRCDSFRDLFFQVIATYTPSNLSYIKQSTDIQKQKYLEALKHLL